VRETSNPPIELWLRLIALFCPINDKAVYAKHQFLPAHDAYAKFDPLQASQNSRTTWFVARLPRRLRMAS
jgi:hypothetical protein